MPNGTQIPGLPVGVIGEQREAGLKIEGQSSLVFEAKMNDVVVGTAGELDILKHFALHRETLRESQGRFSLLFLRVCFGWRRERDGLVVAPGGESVYLLL